MGKNNFFDRIFPAKYDFYGMLSSQSKITAQGVEALRNWLENESQDDYKKLFDSTAEADKIRFALEDKLIEAFATPFDRQDIYSISVEMDRIIEFAKWAIESMEGFQIKPDTVLIKMTQMLYEGVYEFSEAVLLLENKPKESQSRIEKIRKAQVAVEHHYREGMIALYKSTDAMNALRYREVYHYIKDAAMYLGYTVDVFHKIVVRVV